MSFHPNVDQAMLDEASRPSLDLDSLNVGQLVRLELAEGLDLEDELTLGLTLEQLPPDGESHEFRITDGQVPDSVVEKNRRSNLAIPEMLGSLVLVRGSCLYRRDYMPPITMAHPGHIDKDRHVWTTMETNGANGSKAMEYFPFVRNFTVSG